MSKLLADLKEPFQQKARQAYTDMSNSTVLKSFGVEKIAISETKRELSVQMAYYSRGRMSIEDVRKMYKAAGLYTPTDAECKTPNTQTLQSKHIEGLAVDFVPVKDGKYWWNAPSEVWNEMGNIGKAWGMKWGGDWKGFSDTPHFEA